MNFDLVGGITGLAQAVTGQPFYTDYIKRKDQTLQNLMKVSEMEPEQQAFLIPHMVKAGAIDKDTVNSPSFQEMYGAAVVHSASRKRLMDVIQDPNSTPAQVEESILQHDLMGKKARGSNAAAVGETVKARNAALNQQKVKDAMDFSDTLTRANQIAEGPNRKATIKDLLESTAKKLGFNPEAEGKHQIAFKMIQNLDQTQLDLLAKGIQAELKTGHTSPDEIIKGVFSPTDMLSTTEGIGYYIKRGQQAEHDTAMAGIEGGAPQAAPGSPAPAPTTPAVAPGMAPAPAPSRIEALSSAPETKLSTTDQAELSALNIELARHQQELDPLRAAYNAIRSTPAGEKLLTRIKEKEDRIDILRKRAYDIKRGPEKLQEDISKASAVEIARMNAQADPASEAAAAHMVARYELDPHTLSSRGPQTRTRILAMAKAENPNYDQTKYKKKQELIDLYAKGAPGQQIQSFNTALDHLEVLEELGDKLKAAGMKSGSPAWNAAMQWFATQTGSGIPTSYQAAAAIVGEEIVKSIVPGGGGEREREAQGEKLKASLTPEAAAQSVGALKHLMSGQLRSLKKRYEQSPEFHMDPFENMLTETSKKYVAGERRKEPASAEPTKLDERSSSGFMETILGKKKEKK